MTGRARARARGRARVPEQSAPGQPQPQPPQTAARATVRPAAPLAPLEPEPQLVGRGRQRGPPIGERPPADGETGSAIQLVTNHIKLVSRPQWVLYQYHIDYNPPMESCRLRTALLFQHEETIGKARAFDGTILFLPKRLNKVTEVFSQTRNGENVRVTITLTNELPPTSPTCFQFYNIIFRRLLKIMNMKQIGRNYYNPSDATEVRAHRLTIWPGFSTSILQYETSIMLNIDVSHKVLRNETVLDIMHNLYQSCGAQSFQDFCIKELVGQIVLTKYNNKTYRIDEINWTATPLDTFKKSDKDITFVDYYKTQYNINVQDAKQPMLVSINKRPRPGVTNGAIMLVPELCNLTGAVLKDALGKFKLDLPPGPEFSLRQLKYAREVPPFLKIWRKKGFPVVVGGVTISQGAVLKDFWKTSYRLTDKMRSDFTVMKDLAVHTRLPPDQRERQVGRFLNYIHKDESVQKELRDWGLNFDTKLLNFKGRVAIPEKILLSGRAVDYNPQFADWSRDMRGPVLLSAPVLNSWLLVYPRRNYEAANALLQNLYKVTQQMGIRMNKAVMVEIEDNVGAYLQAFQREISDQTEMVVCVLSSINKMKYDAIKKYLCLDVPIPSQCVVSRTLSKPQTVMSVCTKIALQMNCKLGGELWSVEIPVERMMVIGIDIYHDTVAGKRSIAGFVASMNKGMTRWFSRCVVQDKKQEIVDGLKVCMQGALHAWYKCNGFLPNRIIIYRDGVGDGQLKTLVSYEVPQIMDCIKTAGKDYTPKLSVVVVKKRINARFFAVLGGRLQNPPPGTIVDTEVTRPEWYDFFIISQSVRQGTVSPTHYNVVYDSGGLKPDHMQRLTYKLCHQYFNWPGVIRVPAPCQYAHKLAFLVGQSIHKEPHNSLANLLYYL